ncbi:MAG: DUF4476 domain-containing protein [Bacteroidales bacterium]|jgi:hypothetical protein|nr:DUF4476 domain-containing protein [Bacteroidales bacterium]
MKLKIFYSILLSAFCFFSSFAQHGSLLVSSSNNQRFWLFIDDVLQNEYSVHSIKVQGMNFKEYKLRIEMDNANANCIGQLVSITNHVSGDSYVVSFRNNGYVITRQQANIRPALIQNIIQPNYHYYNDYYQYLYPGFGNPGNYWQGSSGNQGRSYQSYYQSNTGGHHGGNNSPQVSPSNPPPRPGKQRPPAPSSVTAHSICRNAAEFNIAMNSLRKESFESGKLQFAKNMTVSGPICVEQIIQVCNTFSFESTKLDYAKYAYHYCSDKNLYYLVNNVFLYQSSKDELTKFIR